MHSGNLEQHDGVKQRDSQVELQVPLFHMQTLTFVHAAWPPGVKGAQFDMQMAELAFQRHPVSTEHLANVGLR